MDLFTFDGLITNCSYGSSGNEASIASESRNEMSLVQKTGCSISNLDVMGNAENKHTLSPMLKDELTMIYVDHSPLEAGLGRQLESIIQEELNKEKKPQEANGKEEKTQTSYPPSHHHHHQRGMSDGKDSSYYDESKWISSDPTASMTPGAAGGLTTPPDSTPTTPINMMNINKTPMVNEGPRLTVRNNVYLSELPSHWNTDRLRSVCLTFGGVVSAKVVHDAATNRSREYGFVMFETEEQAALCVKTLNNRPVEGRILTCRLAHERAMPSFARMDRTTWSSSSNTTTTAATPQLAALTEEHLLLQQNGHDGILSRFDGSLTDEYILQGFAPLGGNNVDPRGIPTMQKSRNVFIQGLPLHWNTDKLRSLCGNCGKVQLAKVVRDAITSQSCGHGFVLFETEEQAAVCVERLNGFTTEGKTLICRLAREKRNSPSILPLTGETTPSSPPLILTGGAISSSSTNASPQCGNDSTLGISLNYSTSTLQRQKQQQQQQQSLISPASPSFFNTTPLVGPPLPHGTVFPIMTQPTTTTTSGGGMIPRPIAPHSEFGGVPDVEYRLAAVPNFTNAYFITVPYPTVGLGQVVEPVVGSPLYEKPGMMGYHPGKPSLL
ncbi:RNA recognition motif domain [Trypanosoma melophagium]|uniref:RNA recognition motif domain n=1 Tax=Trypanosoma melophagium TaxID=715481 RepID=UPI00351A4464|nr:RNA recognition motif domain [Trypanosoma melophagium]